VACWSTEAAISLKRVKIEEKLLWRAYRKSQISFERYHPRPLRPPLSKDWVSAIPSQTAIILGMGKATNFKFRGSLGSKACSKFPEKQPWAYSGHLYIGRIARSSQLSCFRKGIYGVHYNGGLWQPLLLHSGSVCFAPDSDNEVSTLMMMETICGGCGCSSNTILSRETTVPLYMYILGLQISYSVYSVYVLKL